MVQILDEFDFNKSWGAPEKYPYDEWFSGKIIQIERGTDFDCHPYSMRTNILNAAQRRKIRVRTSIIENQEKPIGVVFQAVL